MAIHVLKRTQVIRATLDECWEFFSDPHNLGKLTPASLDFMLVGEVPNRIHPGLFIQHALRPLGRLPVKWLTEITYLEEPRYFVDEQRIGPFRIWHHEHWFLPMPDGRCEVRDIVHYVLPLTPFSEIIHGLLIAPQVSRIFAFREKAIRELFPE
jgi:ligand-binding SRPBCC domain-containing protein